jgi:hypothetical protein
MQRQFNEDNNENTLTVLPVKSTTITMDYVQTLILFGRIVGR